ncbi:MAG: secretin N-terminal domain-containing protein, partial [Candidatus Omnitrophota bacterium]|nr:secretin N-terminal domain-containing protein [Candidatus Omnitrophota bacterium]
MMRIFGIIVALLAFSLTSVHAQPAATPQPKEDITVSQEGFVSLDFRDADIQNVLRILSYKSGVNIVAGPEVTGLVTIQLKDVPWKQALDVILQTYGYGYDQKGNIITVTTIENLKKRRENAQILTEQEVLMTKTFPLNYAKASEIIGSVEKMVSNRGSVNYDERTNSLIVRDTSDNIDLMTEVIGRLDSTTPQVLIEAKIVETTLNNTENLGIDWVTEATVSGSKRPTLWPFTTHSSNKYLPDNIPAAEDTEFSFGTINFSQLQAVLELLRTRTDTNILSNPRIVTLDNQPAQITVGSQYPIPTYVYNEEQARLQVNGWEYKDIGIIFSVTPHVNNAGFVTLDIEPKVTDILDFVTVENTSLPRLSSES